MPASLRCGSGTAASSASSSAGPSPSAGVGAVATAAAGAAAGDRCRRCACRFGYLQRSPADQPAVPCNQAIAADRRPRRSFARRPATAKPPGNRWATAGEVPATLRSESIASSSFLTLLTRFLRSSRQPFHFEPDGVVGFLERLVLPPLVQHRPGFVGIELVAIVVEPSALDHERRENRGNSHGEHHADDDRREFRPLHDAPAPGFEPLEPAQNGKRDRRGRNRDQGRQQRQDQKRITPQLVDEISPISLPR